MRPRVALHAPMKPPDHPTPSGDREIARLVMAALGAAGAEPCLVSRLRTHEPAGDAARQAGIAADADAEAARIVHRLAAAPPAAWITYHCYWKAPDLLGPTVSAALGIPYLIIEPSISPRRRAGPWAGFARAAEAAIAAADRLFWTTARDRPALEAAGHGEKMTHLPAFLDPGPRVPPRPAGTPLRLVTVAMMREGDKAESYRRIAEALPHLRADWRLEIVGDGPARAEIEARLAPVARRVTWLGALPDPAAVRARLEAADLMVWPGVNEGVGLAWLEAEAAGCPVVAEEGPAAHEIVGTPTLAPPGDARALAAAIEAAARDRAALSALARAHVERHHGLDAAAGVLAAAIPALAREPAR